FALELCDRRVLAHQPLLDRAGPLQRRQRLRQPAGLALHDGYAVVARGQFALELGDRWVLSSQPLPKRAGPLQGRHRLRRPASRPRIASDSSKARRASCLSPISAVSLPRSKLAAARPESESGVVSRSAWSRSRSRLKNACGSFSSVARSLAKPGLFFSSGVSR